MVGGPMLAHPVSSNVPAQSPIKAFIHPAIPELPAEHRRDPRPAEVHAFDRLARLHLVVNVAPRGEYVAPAERVADASHRLPGELRLARSNIDVVRDEPPRSGEARTPPQADDRVP